jgi:hypothetical protein
MMSKLLWSNISAEGGAGTHPNRGFENTDLFTGLAIFWLADPYQGSLTFYWTLLPNFYRHLSMFWRNLLSLSSGLECVGQQTLKTSPFLGATALLRVHRKENRTVKKYSLCQGLRMIFSWWGKKMEHLGLGKGWPISGFLQTRSEK